MRNSYELVDAKHQNAFLPHPKQEVEMTADRLVSRYRPDKHRALDQDQACQAIPNSTVNSEKERTAGATTRRTMDCHQITTRRMKWVQLSRSSGNSPGCCADLSSSSVTHIYITINPLSCPITSTYLLPSSAYLQRCQFLSQRLRIGSTKSHTRLKKHFGRAWT